MKVRKFPLEFKWGAWVFRDYIDRLQIDFCSSRIMRIKMDAPTKHIRTLSTQRMFVNYKGISRGFRIVLHET